MGDRSGTREGHRRFVIQEHHARSLHWDLRLERDGVLASWALPKGLPETPEQNHLAVHTEDHPLEYASFEGDIPQGEYGGGRMTIWDSGHYDAEKWSDTEVKFVLHGTRASGGFVLFQTKDRNWMIHRHGPSTRTDPLPHSLKPMLAVAGKLPPDSDNWAFEIKWDGVRAILTVEGGRVQAHSRNDLDVSASFPELADIGEFLGMTTCVLDGEIVALGEDGRPSFSRLQRRMHVANPREARRRAVSDPISFVAFDLLYLDGHSLLADGYDVRRAHLESLHLTGETFTTTESFRDVSGHDVLAAVVRNGLEGVVAKRRDSPYRPGRRSARLGQGQVLPHARGGDWRLDGRARRAAGKPRRAAARASRTLAGCATSARWEPGSAPRRATSSWSICGGSRAATVPSGRRCPQVRQRRHTSSGPSSSGRSSSASGPPRTGSVIPRGAACARTSHRTTLSRNDDPDVRAGR